MPIALITGASAGIGKTFAEHLARDGYDLILVARRKERLDEVGQNLSEKYGVSVESLPADLSDREQIDRVADRIRELDHLNLLINNAGFGLGGSFSRTDLERQQIMLDVHVTAIVRLTHAAISGMHRARSGAIINVSSIASFLRVAGSPMYTGTKLFVNSFSQNLASEVGHKGIKVQALCPGYTYTEFHDTPDMSYFDRKSYPDWMWLSAESVVTYSLKMLNTNKVIVVPGWQYKLMRAILGAPGVSAIAGAIRRNAHRRSKAKAGK